MKDFGIKHIAAIIVGTILYFMLGRFITLPSGIPNTNISFHCGILSLIAAIFGPIPGLITGFAGQFLVDASYGWGVWWSNVIAASVFGGIHGMIAYRLNVKECGFTKEGILKFNISQVISNLLAWSAVAPLLDIIIYGEGAGTAFVKGLSNTGANIITTAVLGTLLYGLYVKLSDRI